MSDQSDLRSKAHVIALLRRIGVPEETVTALDAVLDDPVDLVRDANLLASYGLTRDNLIDRMGGSP
jgi:hypothetical protein